MGVNVESVTYYGGSPEWLGRYRHAGYLIRGRGFGTRPGLVTVHGEPQKVVEWSPDCILIAKPAGNLFWSPARAPETLVEITTAKRGRLAANDAVYVAAA